jgi:hypothetical protein
MSTGEATMTSTGTSTRMELDPSRTRLQPRPLRTLLRDIAQDGKELAATATELTKRRGERATKAMAARLGAGFLAALLLVLALHDLVAGAVDLKILTPREVGFSELARGGGTLLVAVVLVVAAELAARRIVASKRAP